MTMQTFEAGSRTYELLHISEDDSRVLVDSTGNMLLTIDSSLNFFDGEGEQIGWLTPLHGEWAFEELDKKGVTTLDVALNDFDWRKLLEAEIVVCRSLIERVAT